MNPSRPSRIPSLAKILEQTLAPTQLPTACPRFLSFDTSASRNGGTIVLEPTPETIEALTLLEEQGDHAVALSLEACARRACAIVPDLNGLSLAFRGDEPGTGLTFTMTRRGEPEVQPTDPIHSSLVLALVHHGRTDGTISLFASSPTAFQGREADLARALGSDPNIGVTNESTDNRPELVAQRIREHDLIDQAVGFIASARDTDVADAEQLLRRSAKSAGQSEIQTAERVLSARIDQPGPGTPPA